MLTDEADVQQHPPTAGMEQHCRQDITAGHLLEGEIIFILVTFLSMMSDGRSNSSIMHSGMAPPHGCTAENRESEKV